MSRIIAAVCIGFLIGEIGYRFNWSTTTVIITSGAAGILFNVLEFITKGELV